jgi:ribosome-associated protein
MEGRTISDERIEQLAKDLAAAALQKKAHDVAILDLRGLADYADFFVIATANNARQVRAISDAMRMAARELHGISAVGSEGQASGRWALNDLGDVVTHVFERDMRGFYDLDGLWADAPRLALPDVQPDAEDLPEPFFTIG